MGKSTRTGHIFNFAKCKRLRLSPEKIQVTMTSLASWWSCRVRGATPRSSKVCPQKGWSKAKGISSCGRFARAAASTVPMPPWCSASAQRGSSQPCGTARAQRKMWGSSGTWEALGGREAGDIASGKHSKNY